MPSSLKAKRCLLSALPQPLHGKIYELGTGWGTLLFPLARQYPDCQVVGFETSPIPYLVSRIRQLYCRLPNVVLERRDFFSVLYGDADLIVCYLYPGAMRKLQVKFDRELKPGTWVVSNTFALPGWTPVSVIEVRDLYYSKIYVYLFDKKSI